MHRSFYLIAICLLLTSGLGYGQKSPPYDPSTGSYTIGFDDKSQTNKKKPVPNPVTTYRDQELGFEVSYPKNWYPAESVRNAAFLLRLDSKTDLASISFNATNFTGDKDKFMDDIKRGGGAIFVKKLQDRFPTAKLVKEGETSLGSFPAYYLVLQYTVSNLDMMVDLVMMQIHCIRKDKIYLVTLESNLSIYEDALKDFHKIIATFNYL